MVSNREDLFVDDNIHGSIIHGHLLAMEPYRIYTVLNTVLNPRLMTSQTREVYSGETKNKKSIKYIMYPKLGFPTLILSL